MKAAIIRRFSEPYDIANVPIPRVEPGQCLVRVMATGLCGTDLKIAAGAFPDAPLPMIPGHEVAGEVVEDVGPLKKGQRVAIHTFNPCGNCRWCRLGQETLCPNPPRIGFNRDGGLAEFIAVPIRCAVPFADTVSFEAAAVAMDAVVSPWRALIVRGQLAIGESLVVVGAGGLGLNAVQIARSAGARVAVVDPIGSHRDEALRTGAELAVEAQDIGTLLDWSEGGANMVYEVSGTRAGLEAAGRIVGPGGRLICGGWGPGIEYGLQSRELVLREISIIGSRGGTLNDVRAVLQALERGQVQPTVEKVQLSEINDVLQRLREGRVVGRFVVDMSRL